MKKMVGVNRRVTKTFTLKVKSVTRLLFWPLKIKLKD